MPLTVLEDPLVYLPRSDVSAYKKGDSIYMAGEPATSIYLVLRGLVQVSRVAEKGSPMVVDVYQTDELFGEGVFLNVPNREERATALEDCTIMAWEISELAELFKSSPELAIALLQLMTQRAREFTVRIASLTTETVSERLARSLIRLSERLGMPTADGALRMRSFTHEFLANYAGTSRELVTQEMNRFRNRGFIWYTRKEITVFPEALRAWMDGESGNSEAEAGVAVGLGAGWD